MPPLTFRRKNEQPALTGSFVSLEPASLVMTSLKQADDGKSFVIRINNPLDAHWESGYFQDGERLNFGYVTANVTGSGTLQMILRKGDQAWYRPIRGWFLNTTAFTDAERQIQIQGYRMAIRFGTVNLPNTVASDFFTMQNLDLYVAEAAYAPVRGINA